MANSARISPEVRFAFGANWQRFLEHIDEGRIVMAESALKRLLGVECLDGRQFLDAGCGSGLFSLAAHRLGAAVVSFDLDPKCVACAEELRRRAGAEPRDWTVQLGSVLDEDYLRGKGAFDVVYSWGVLHHTGSMWTAIDNVARAVAPGGLLAIALYNDQGLRSDAWRIVKRAYNRLPAGWRFLVLWPALVRLWGPTLARDLVGGHPLRTWSAYREDRGMSPLVDVRDWVGGYPFEVATPEAVIAFCAKRGLFVEKTVLRSGIGCNEYAFRRF